ncbi:MAG: glycosyltransferase family 2 protein [Actinomycetes bacterium]
MAGPPRVDVGMVTWNTRDLSLAALAKLTQSDQNVDIRVLLRDNGSTDGTAEAVRAEFPDVVVDSDGDNLGFGAGMNRLLARSTAPWFFALNGDAWPEPGAIGTLVTAATKHPRVGAVAPRLERPDGSLEHSTHRFPSVRLAARSARPGWVQRHPERAHAELLHEAWRHDETRLVDWAVGAALLMRRTTVDEAGGFDERLFMYAEDLEWCWRAHDAGWSVLFCHDAVVRHVGNVSGAQSYGGARSAAYWRNTYRVYRDKRGVAAAAAYRGTNLLGTTAAYFRYIRNPGLRRYWRQELRGHLSSTRGPDGPPQRAG